MSLSLADPVDLYQEEDIEPQRASAQSFAYAKARRDRRAYQRLRDGELEWIRSARLGGKGVSLVDLSAGGALLDSPVLLRPDSLLTLQLSGRGVETAIDFRVLRCQVGSIGAAGPTYRAACEFTRLVDLPRLRPIAIQEISSGGFVGLDLALKQLVERAGFAGVHSLDADCVIQALRALQIRAANQPMDPIGNLLADLLGRVVPALELATSLPTILRDVEVQLRKSVPQATLRLVGQGDAPSSGVRSTLIKVPGAPLHSALVSIDIPRGVVLNDWQSRTLRITSRVVALLQCLEPQRETGPSPASPEISPTALEVSVPPEPGDEGHSASLAWQKIVVRYAEGQILKGYTHDFSPMRSQFSLWTSTTAAAHERIIVPLARLKGVFFVRDFAGNPGYVERTDSGESQHGRRIEVTLIDEEVIVGRTLSYRPDGHGFFVVPADPLANNIRVFVVSSSVRQVRFP
jgi:hypothetical protein